VQEWRGFSLLLPIGAKPFLTYSGVEKVLSTPMI
jgi:hypothetical protein